VKKHDRLPGDALAPEAPGAELQALFDSARADGFSGTETDELWSRVGAALAAPGAAASASSRGASGAGASTAGGTGVAVKIAAALLVGGAVAAGVAYREMAPRPSPVITVHTAPVEVDPSPTGAPTGVIDPAPAVAIDDLPRASDPAPSGLVAPRTRATPERHDTSRSRAPLPNLAKTPRPHPARPPRRTRPSPRARAPPIRPATTTAPRPPRPRRIRGRPRVRSCSARGRSSRRTRPAP